MWLTETVYWVAVGNSFYNPKMDVLAQRSEDWSVDWTFLAPINNRFTSTGTVLPTAMAILSLSQALMNQLMLAKMTRIYVFRS